MTDVILLPDDLGDAAEIYLVFYWARHVRRYCGIGVTYRNPALEPHEARRSQT